MKLEHHVDWLAAEFVFVYGLVAATIVLCLVWHVIRRLIAGKVKSAVIYKNHPQMATVQAYRPPANVMSINDTRPSDGPKFSKSNSVALGVLDDEPSVRRSVSNIEHDLEIDEDEMHKRLLSQAERAPVEMTQSGYKNHYLGECIFLLLCLSSTAIVAVLLWFVREYYRLGPEYDRTQLAAFFLCWFHFANAWFITLMLAGSRIRLWFRIRTPLRGAQYVKMWVPGKQVVFMKETGCAAKLSELIKSIGRRLLGKPGLAETCKVDQLSNIAGGMAGNPFVYYQMQRYIYDHDQDVFSVPEIEIGQTYEDFFQSQGLTDYQAEQRAELVGPNSIMIPIPSLVGFISMEFCTFFYLYQAFILLSWFFWDYWKMGFFVSTLVLSGGFYNVWVNRSAKLQVQALTQSTSDVVVKRDGYWKIITSPKLAPGDIVELRPGALVCDLVLIQGTAVTDESALTGESMPVQKVSISNTPTFYDPMKGKKHTLWAGTTVLADDETETKPLALVLKTGIQTSKGDLIKDILYPVPLVFKFNDQVTIFYIALVAIGFMCFGISVVFSSMHDNSETLPFMWLSGLFVVSSVIPPLLPTVFLSSIAIASKRLLEYDILCTEPARVMVCGKIKIWCFDKTGTLTKQGLDFIGTRPVSDEAFDEMQEDLSSRRVPNLLKRALASCHSVSIRGGKLFGNAVDCQMFGATGWSIRSQGGNLPCDEIVSPVADKIKVLRRFDFDHHRMTMTVITNQLAPDGSGDERTVIFVKGSYEKIGSICTGIPKSYEKVTTDLAKEGCYVLGLAYRVLDSTISLDEASKMNRDELEQDLTCLGLVVFRNQLKPDSADAIKRLKKGAVRPVMVTGDNELTGAYIARACGMIEPGMKILNGKLVKSSGQQGMHRVMWLNEDDEEVKLPVADEDLCKYELCVQAPLFRHLRETGEIDPILTHIRVFARMKPDDKVDCVQLHMLRGMVGMCGDGGNDCAALRAAHAGVALSDSDASVVSPFSGRSKSVQSVADLLCNGRAALATSFASFKYMLVYGLVLSLNGLCRNYINVNFSEVCWILLRGMIVLVVGAAISFSRPRNKMKKHTPTSSLIGPTTLFSLAGQLTINLGFVLVALYILHSESWYLPPCDFEKLEGVEWELTVENYDAAVIFLFCMLQLVNGGFAVNFGGKFRRSWYRNYIFVAVYFSYIFMICYILFKPGKLSRFFSVNIREKIADSAQNTVLPDDFRYTMFFLLFGNTVAVFFWERFIVVGPVSELFRPAYIRSQKRIPVKL